MSNRIIGIVVGLLLVAFVGFAVYPSFDPLTFEYNNMWGERPAPAMEMMNSGHGNLAMAKGLVLRGMIGDSLQYVGRALQTPGGLITIVLGLYILSLVVWIAVCWAVGKRKNSPWLGLTLGILLGPIGLVITLLLPERKIA